jgi:glycosyltransferase involved in cell wall biosynthesis
VRPRVLVLITLAEVGGAQTYVMSLLPALTERFDVTVAAWGPGPLREAAERAGATYVPLRWVQRELHAWRDLRGLVELVQLMRRIDPHLVHANSSKAGILGRLAAAITRVPARVFTVHGWAFKAYDGAAARLYRSADRALRPLTTAIVCVSRTELEAGLRARTCSADRTVVIRNAVEVAGAPEPTLDGDPPVVLSVGRLKEPKTFDTLLRALAELDPASFRAQIVGDGPDRARLEERARGPVELLGERDDVPQLLAGSDIFVLSSASEGLPMSLLEAMAAGLPVVASAVGGVPELVGDAGLLVPPRDHQALAEAIARLIADPALRRELGAAGRRRVETEFSLEEFRAAHVALYERLLAPIP